MLLFGNVRFNILLVQKGSILLQNEKTGLTNLFFVI